MRFQFVILTDCFFFEKLRKLKSHREIDLDHLAQFIHEYLCYFANPHITISGHTDKTWLSPERDRLSLHYAETIAQFFREDGIQSYYMMLVGRGAKIRWRVMVIRWGRRLIGGDDG